MGRERPSSVEAAIASGQRCAAQSPGSDAKSAGPVSEIDELQGVDRRVPFILGLLQGKLQLLGAAYAAPHQDQPAKPNGDPDDYPNRRDGRQTEHQADKQRCPGEGARASAYLRHGDCSGLVRGRRNLDRSQRLKDAVEAIRRQPDVAAVGMAQL